MSPEARNPEEGAPETQQADPAAQLLERRRAQTEQATRNAMRRVPLVIATVLLVALALWYLQS